MDINLKEVVNLFGAFVVSMQHTLKRTINMSDDLIYGEEVYDSSSGYSYVAIPLKPFNDTGIDKDDLDKLFSLMAFFVDNTIGAGNIYLTTRKNKLVIEIAW